MRTFYLLTFTLLCLLTAAMAQEKPTTGAIYGVVVDDQNKPVDYATVSLFKAADSALVKTAVTDPNGKFQFAEIKMGSYFIKTHMMGFVAHKTNPFSLSSAYHDLANIKLVANSKTLNTISVVTTKPLIERKTDKLVMNVENSTIAIGTTALELLQKAPGVTVDQNDRISMQGKQGVLILLDGKQTYMSGADVANLLRNMQSEQIETIELITNPSSKYDASGNSGIINIRTKKSKNGGTNGSANLALGYGQNFRGNAGINLNHRTQKLNVFGNYNYGQNRRENLITIDRISNGTPDTYFMQQGDSYRKGFNNNFKAGIDFFLDKNNTLGVLATGYFNSAKEFNDNKTLIGPSFSTVDSTLMAMSTQKNRYHNVSYNLNYKSVLDTAGQELSIDLDYSKFNGDDDSNYDNTYRFANGSLIRPTEFTRNGTPSQIDIKAFKIDYTLPINKTMRLEAGAKSSWVKTDNNLIAERYKNNAWQNDTRRSNRFVYDENVNAAYANFNKQFKSTSVQVGLRIEQTNSTGNLITTNNVVKRSYWDLFPTVFVQQNLNKNNQIGFSYSRRIDRPSYDALNPFVYFLDQYTYNKGNPFLNPQYTHSFEVSYTFMQQYLLSLSYSRVNDVITQVLLPDESQKALYQTNANLARNTSYGANLNVPVKVAKWWTMNHNLNVFHLSFESPDLAGKALKTGKTSFQFKTQQSFIIVNGLTAELFGSYESPLDYGTLSLRSRYSVDAGINKSLFNKKANLKFAVSDIFNTNETNLTSAYPGLRYDVYQKNETQVARVSFSYRFGKNEIKPARRRSTGTEAEQGRMKN